MEKSNKKTLTKKRSKKEILALFMAEIKNKLASATIGKRILFFSLIAFWIAYNTLCILTIPDREISMWWFAFISNNPLFWLFRSMAIWMLMLVFGSFAVIAVAHNLIGIDEKFGNVEIWIMFWAVMASAAMRLILADWQIALIVILAAILLLGLPTYIICKVAERRGERIPGGFDITD